ncbi:hypothetical protein OUZ56_000902 [Daphnia magna]|uniref:Uncharacterized protein n=1 Tax=Daphnia magna TaxID=35525 RepID=A0ABR0A131_9CRUS|nr:hypothetical protein OUZ56_000902 [Daphnia magna]
MELWPPGRLRPEYYSNSWVDVLYSAIIVWPLNYSPFSTITKSKAVNSRHSRILHSTFYVYARLVNLNSFTAGNGGREILNHSKVNDFSNKKNVGHTTSFRLYA